MRKTIHLFFLLIFLITQYAFKPNATHKYKCLIQMTNYSGQPAYVIVSILNENNNYVKTLKIQGSDPEWYHEFNDWNIFYENQIIQNLNSEGVQAITGPTLAGGERSIFGFEIDQSYLKKGYKIRFESGVEDQKIIHDDVTLILNDSIIGQHEGSGYIRYVKIKSM